MYGKDLLFFLRQIAVTGSCVWNESAEWICDSVKVKFSDPSKNVLMVIKYKLHGSFSIFQWKRKGRTSKTFCSNSDCANLLLVLSSMCACSCMCLWTGFQRRCPAVLRWDPCASGSPPLPGSRGLATTQQRSGKIKDSDVKDNRQVAQDWQISLHKSGTIKRNHTSCFQLNQSDDLWVSALRLDYIKHIFCTYNHITTQSKKIKVAWLNSSCYICCSVQLCRSRCTSDVQNQVIRFETVNTYS